VQATESSHRPSPPASGAVQLITRQSSPIYFAAIFGWTMSGASAAMCAIVRMPLGSPHWFVFVKAFLLLGAVISCAVVLIVRRVEERDGAYAPVLMSTLAVMFLPCLAWLIGPAADIVAYPVLLGLFAVGVRSAIAASRVPGSRPVLALACGCAAGIGYFLLINSRGYATVLTPELALVGTQHLDTLFHASIANMLVKHGALSTGLDGLVPLKYHVLSHIWLGCISLWLGVSTLEGYYIGAQVIAIPMLLFSLSLATYLLRRPGEGVSNAALIALGPLLLLFVADIWGATSYLVSESYFFAMILFLLTLPLLADMAKSPRGHRLDMQLAALCVAGILILLSKISVGVIFWGAAGFLLWRQFGMTLLNLIKLAVPILVLVWLCARVGSPDSGLYMEAFAPFSFVREFPRAAWPNIAANLLLLYAASQVWKSGTSRDRRIAEIFAIIALASTFPALLLRIAGGSAYYFANVGTWAAIVFCSAYNGVLLNTAGRRLLKPGIILATIVLLAFATDEKRNSAAKFAMQFSDLQTRVRQLTGKSAGEEMKAWQRIVALLAPGHPARLALAEDVRQTPGGQAKQTLLSMGLMRDSLAIVFVPPENSAFWTNYQDCRGDPFFVPAILGAPMLKGLNPSARKCARDRYYSFAAYKPDASSEASTDSQLCTRAADSGFNRVLVLMTPAAGRKIQCSSDH
jgi:hypothetical protein